MCNHAQTGAMPKRIAHLRPGMTTPSEITFCEDDNDHMVVENAWAIWDPHLQTRVFEDVAGEKICNDCDGPLETEGFSILNFQAINDARKSIIEEHAALTAMLSRPLETGPASSSAPGSASRVWVKEVCGHCGAEGPLIDAYSEYDPLLEVSEITTTFDKGHFCRTCDGETRPKEVRMSNHEVMQMIPRIEARIAALAEELVGLDRWIVAHGAGYELNKDWIALIAAGPGRLEQLRAY